MVVAQGGVRTEGAMITDEEAFCALNPNSKEGNDEIDDEENLFRCNAICTRYVYGGTPCSRHHCY